MMYTYYSHLVFLPEIHNDKGKYIHIEVFKNIPHLIILILLNVDCLQDDFVMYKYKGILRKIEVIRTIIDSMIHEDCCQKITHH